MNPCAVLFGIVFTICVTTGLHKVDEGYIAVYFRGGALLDTIADPGWRLKIPVVTTYE